MSRIVEDTALLQTPFPLGKNGIQSIVDFWHDATPEVKNLLANECDIIFQCRACDNFFRSLINFISHKRTFCRTLYGLQNEANLKACTQVAEEICGHISSANEENQVLKKPRGLLKRTSIVGVLNRRIEHCKISGSRISNSMDVMTLPRITKSVPITTFHHGEQVLETLPQQLTSKELVPKMRTALVMPQDNNVQYREMNLRRRDNNQKDNIARDITPTEVEVVCRVEKLVPGLVDLGSLRCLHKSCKSTRTFFSILGLAYHISVKHNYRSLLDKTIPCFICGCSYRRYAELVNHLEEMHDDVYDEHHAFRTPSSFEKEHKKCKKSKLVIPNFAIDSRSHSLSPLPADYIPDESFVEEDDEATGKFSDDFLGISNDIIRKIKASDISECSDVVGREKSSDDDRTLVECRCDLLQIHQTLATSQLNRARGLSQIIRFLQINSSRSGSGELEMKHCKQTVLDCLESIVDRVCDMETKTHFERSKRNILTVRKDELLEDNQRVHEISKNVQNSERDLILPKTITQCEVLECSHQSSSTEGYRNESKEKIADKSFFKVKSEDDLVFSSAAGSSSSGIPDIFKSGSCENTSVTDFNESSFHSQDGCSSMGNQDLEDDTEIDSTGASSRNYKKKKREIRQRRMVNLERAREAKKALLGVKLNDEEYDNSICSKHVFSKDSLEVQSKTKTEEQVASLVLKSRPTRQRRKPNWIDEESFMTTGYGRKKRRQESVEEASVKEGINPVVINKNKSTDCLQNLAYSSRDVGYRTGENSGRTYCSSYQFYRSDSGNLMHSGASAVTSKTSNLPYLLTQPIQNYDRDNLEADNIRASTSSFSRAAKSKFDELRPDPARTPVYLTEAQKELLFSFIVPLSNSDNEPYKCAHCNATFPDINEGRLHAVGHIRIIRLRCSLCGCGSFYCSAMRDHLRMRHCPMLCRAPKDYVLPLGQTPCMSYKEADSLIEIVDKAKPGRIKFASGKIISSARLTPHFPDPKIEKRILGNRQSSDVEGTARAYDTFHIKSES